MQKFNDEMLPIEEVEKVLRMVSTEYVGTYNNPETIERIKNRVAELLAPLVPAHKDLVVEAKPTTNDYCLVTTKLVDKENITYDDIHTALYQISEEFNGYGNTPEAAEKIKKRVVELLSAKLADDTTLDISVQDTMDGVSVVVNAVKSKASKVEGLRFTHVSQRNLAFHEAMEALDNGFKVARNIWGGYWHMVDVAKWDNEGIKYKKQIVAELKDGGWAIASPYQDDMLANDWMIVD